MKTKLLDDKEQKALSRIRAYLDSGRSLEEIRQAGWGDWIDLFLSRGIDLGFGQTIESPQEAVPSATEPPGRGTPKLNVSVRDRDVREVRRDTEMEPKIVVTHNIIAFIGKIAGLAIIVLGVSLSIWSAVELGELFNGGEKFRSFASDALLYFSFGGIMYLVAEVIDRVSGKKPE